MNPAPRTTEEEWEEWPKEWVVRADLARELETELTEARREIEEQARLLSISGSEVAALKRPLLRLTSLWHQLLFILEITEESDSGNEFRPNYISSCRAVDGDRMQKILEEAKQIVNGSSSDAIRAKMNSLTDEERAIYTQRGMQLINAGVKTNPVTDNLQP